jgi:predicted alternative tryptophan synthase beta-subunit
MEASKVLKALTTLPKVFEGAEEIGANFLLFNYPFIETVRKSGSYCTGYFPAS